MKEAAVNGGPSIGSTVPDGHPLHARPGARRHRTGPTGVGLGLRWDFLEDFLDLLPSEVAFVEVSPENYMGRGGYYPAQLERVGEHYPIVTHGLTMSLGAVDPPPDDYLEQLKHETRSLGTPWHSDHLCFSTAGPRVLHDLLPLKHSRENVERVGDRVRAVRDRLGLPMAIENISWYAYLGREEMSEAEFVCRVLDRAECDLLLDVNNVYVNSLNHGFDPYDFLRAIPMDRVVQLHVAGHTHRDDGIVIDTHGADVVDPVFELLEWTVERTGPIPVLLERDHRVPPLTDLLAEVRALASTYERGTTRSAARASGRQVTSDR